MPNIAYGNTQAQREDLINLKAKNYDYKYPNGMNLKPGSELHDRLRDMILEKASVAASSISTRFDSWNQMDMFLTAYKPIDEEERSVISDDSRKPVSIVFPYSYAILETLLSYMISAFFQDPIFRYEGVGSDDVVGSILMEKIISLHCNKFKIMLNLHTMFRDAFSYGIGIVAPIWKSTYDGKFSGNALINIDPYRYLPDPNVAADKIQDGEFVGWVNDTNYFDLLTQEANDKNTFNVQYVKHLGDAVTSVYGLENSNRYQRAGDTLVTSNGLRPVQEIPMYVKLIPSEWGLSESDKPEKWYFNLVGDAVITSARPSNFDHGKFPIAVTAPDFDGYSSTPLSRLEILSGLQGVLDWLFNSHIANVRKAINDMIIYDPFLVNANDLKDPKPGKLIRIRKPGWGKGVKDAVQQLQVNDITRANVGDSNWIVQWMQKIGATDDVAMGSMRSGGPERVTKAEFQGTASGAVSRLERIAKVIGLQAMQDIGEMFASHTIQVMDEPAYVKVAGDWQDILMEEFDHSISRGRMKIYPDQLNVMTDVLVRDGSVPGGNYSEVWMRMFDIISKEPQLAQHFDIVKIFKHIARNSGAKNVNEFVRRGGNIQSQVTPNDQVAQQLQAGNIGPI